MSMGGDLSQKIWIEMQAVGGDVVDEVNRQIQHMGESQRLLIQALSDGHLTIAQTVEMYNKMATAINGIVRTSKDFVEATKIEAQAVKDLADIRANLAEKAAADGKAAIDEKLRLLAQEKEAETTAAQAARDMAAVRASLADKAARESQEAVDKKLAAIEQEKAAERELADSVAKIRMQAADAREQAAQKAQSASQNSIQAEKDEAKAVAYLEGEEKRLMATMTEMYEQERMFPTIAKSATLSLEDQARASKKAAEAADHAREQYRHFTRAILLTSQGVQDMEYGFRSIVNNIPMAVSEWTRVMGGSMDAANMWGAALGIAATAASALQPAIQKLWYEFTTSDAMKSVKTVESIKRELDYLHLKSFVIHVDAKQMEELEEKAKRAKTAVDAAESASSKMTEEQAEANKRMTHAIVESAGGTDRKSGEKNLVNAMAAFQDANPEMFKTDAALQESKANAAKLAEMKADKSLPANEDEMIARIARQAELQKRIEEFEAQRRKNLALVIGETMTGVDDSIDIVESYIDQDKAFFAKRGIGPQFRTEIAAARRGVVRTDLAAGNQDPLWKTKQTAAREENRRLDKLKKDQDAADKKAASEKTKYAKKVNKIKQATDAKVIAGKIHGAINQGKAKVRQTIHDVTKTGQRLAKEKRDDAAEQAKRDQAVKDVAGRAGGDKQQLEARIAGAALRRTRFESAPPMMQRAMRDNEARELKLQARKLRAQAKGMRPKTASEREKVARLQARAAELEARSKKPFATAEEEKSQIIGERADELMRSGVKIKDAKTGQERPIGIGEAVDAAQGQVNQAQNDLNAKLMMNQDTTITQQERMMMLINRLNQIANQQASRLGNVNGQVNNMRFANINTGVN